MQAVSQEINRRAVEALRTVLQLPAGSTGFVSSDRHHAENKVKRENTERGREYSKEACRQNHIVTEKGRTDIEKEEREKRDRKEQICLQRQMRGISSSDMYIC